MRQDSGDPLAFAEKMLRCYEGYRIDPRSKTIVFSDGLNIAAVKKIHDFCRDKVRDVYGIGTHLTNDVGVKPLNIVIKLHACQRDEHSPWLNTVKLSDNIGKHLGDAASVRICRELLGCGETLKSNLSLDSLFQNSEGIPDGQFLKST